MRSRVPRASNMRKALHCDEGFGLLAPAALSAILLPFLLRKIREKGEGVEPQLTSKLDSKSILRRYKVGWDSVYQS